MLENENKIKKVVKKYDLKMVLLFGSRVSGRINFDSDVDIAYLSGRELSGKEIINLNCDFIDIFNCDKIDMVDLKRVNPFLRYEISRNSKLLFGNEIDYLKFKAFAFRSYIDHQPLFKLQDILLKRRHELLRKSIYGK